jgi:aminoglycoside phosphotransferase (APT) family kinase protein
MRLKGLLSIAEIRAATIELSNENALEKVCKVRDNLVVKYGEAVIPREAETLRFLTENSSVRVPRVHGSFTDPATKEHSIIMDFIPGQTLEQMLPTLTEGEKAEITEQIKETLTDLRKIPNQGYIGGVGRTPIPHDTFWNPRRARPTNRRTLLQRSRS